MVMNRFDCYCYYSSGTNTFIVLSLLTPTNTYIMHSDTIYGSQYSRLLYTCIKRFYPLNLRICIFIVYVIKHLSNIVANTNIDVNVCDRTRQQAILF